MRCPIEAEGTSTIMDFVNVLVAPQAKMDAVRIIFPTPFFVTVVVVLVVGPSGFTVARPDEIDQVIGVPAGNPDMV